ncbi:hypothetical protein FDENT_1352 [Fusarium denticulatum]|uniref:Uncharacterized protein n=1 Tax=Fusarium denticulatum TaxID=48507 RepID=A0A8H6CVV0_9HYPO|nr:hypothetical protein FDENT_1352 [Fusarium denticulatum]
MLTPAAVALFIVTYEDKKNNAAAMKATGMCSLECLLGTLGNALPSRDSPCVVIVSVSREDYISQLSGDGVNDERFGYSASRTVAHTLPPVSFRPDARLQNVTQVPICKAAEPETFAAKVPVAKNNVFTDVTKRELQSVERGAGSEARRAGNFAATASHVIGIDEADKVTAPLQSLLVRVVADVISA